jgi:hypothetical protein
MMKPLNVALLVADLFRLGFGCPWNRYHFALADVCNPDCSGQEQEMGKTVRLDIGRRQTGWSMGDSNGTERSVSAHSGFSTPNRGIRPDGLAS